MKKALVLLGCPEAPSQTPIAIYANYKLKNLDYEVTTAANPAALKLLKISDPEEKYLGNLVDLDRCLNDLNEGEYDLLLGLVTKDAAASFFVTFYHILQTKSIALIFEKDQKLIEEYQGMIEESTDAEIISVRAFHNPNPIKVQLDKVFKEN